MSLGLNQPVLVDAGDLSEALQAATAWAGALRKGLAIANGDQAQAAADRIDQAVHQLRKQSHVSASQAPA